MSAGRTFAGMLSEQLAEARTEGAEAERARIVELVEGQRLHTDTTLVTSTVYNRAIDDILKAIREADNAE